MAKTPGRAREAAVWVVVGQGANHAIRLASNLVLTRLLFPEAFGLMAIVQAVIVGLELVSDLGVGLSVVQNERGEDDEYLNTAWSIQVTRGLGLWGIALVLCIPLGHFYGEPQLPALIAAASFSAVLDGLCSMSLFRMRRKLRIGKLTLIELGTRVVGTVVSIGLALVFASVWVLVAGRILGGVAKLVWSHLVQESPRHRLRWEPEAARSIYRFGRWILIATPFSFLLNQGDRLLLGSFMTMEELGLFAVGALLAKAVRDVSGQVSSRVLFPLYSRVGQQTDAGFRRRVGRIRLALMAVFLPPLWLLVVWGDGLVALLYDDRYLGAGWVTQILAAGMLLPVIGRVGPVFMARGETWVNVLLSAIPGAVLVGGVVVGWSLAGKVGLVAAVAASQAAQYPIQVWVARRYGLRMPMYDLFGVVVSAAVIALGWMLVQT